MPLNGWMKNKASEPVFQRLGRRFQLQIESAQDLEHALGMDDALWVASSAPVDQFRADPALLKAMDLDRDGRIKVGEFKQCLRWTLDVLSDVRGMNERLEYVEAGWICDSHPDGRRILAYLGKRSDQGQLNLADVRKHLAQLKEDNVSDAAAVIPAQLSGETAQRLQVLIDQLGGVPHPSGERGGNRVLLERFLQSIRAYLAWKDAARMDEKTLLPFGTSTRSVHELLLRLEARVEHFYRTCRLIDQDAARKEQIWPIPVQYREETGMDPEALLKLCLCAEPNPECELAFDAALNPLDRDDLLLFQELALPGEEILYLSRWKELLSWMAPYRAWIARAPDIMYEQFSNDDLHAWLTPEYTAELREAMDKASASSLVLENVLLAEKLILFQSCMIEMGNNFINLSRLYDPACRALFEEGVLVMDGRRFTLAVRVTDRADHLKSTSRGALFTLYVRLEHAGRGESFEVAVPVTSGTQGNLAVGKRGVFTDAKGDEWAARVEHIVDQPVSLREAVTAPFQRLGEALTRKIESMSAAAEKEMEKATLSGVGSVAPSPAPGNPVGGMLAGGGIALAALGSSLAFITRTLHEMTLLQVLSGVGGLILALMVPTIVVAWIRLRQRDLSNLLEGSGWAINSRMRLTAAQRKTFTQNPVWPANSRFEDSNEPWKWLLFGLLVVLIAVTLAL